MTASYLIVALTTHQGSDWTEEQFETDYRDNHLPRNVHHIEGIHTGLRYKNLNPDAPFTMLAMYTLSDPGIIGGSESQAKRKEHVEARILSIVRLYSKVQDFGGRPPRERGFSKFLVSAGLGPHGIPDDEIGEWCRRRHVDMLTDVAGYQGSTCWKLTDGGSKVPTGETLKYLTLHEIDPLGLEEVHKHLHGRDDHDICVEDIWELVQIEGKQEGF